jgi:hypothetical protein
MAILENIYANVKAGRRNMRLRGQSPEESLEELKNILIESIHIQNSGSKILQKKSLEELKQLRQDMMAGQISAGSKTNQVVGSYTHVIGQIEEMLDQTNQNNKAYEGAIDSIKGAFPSSDSLVAALMTANPLLGYGVKLFRDMAKSRSEAKQQARQMEQERLKKIKMETELINAQFEQLEKEEAVTEKEEDAIKEKEKPVLERVETDAPVTDNDRQSNILSMTDDHALFIAETIEDSTNKLIRYFEEADKKNDRDEKLTKMKESSGTPVQMPEQGPKGVTQGRKGGMLGMLARGALAIVTGLGLSLAAFTAPLIAMMGILKGIGAFAVKLVSKLALPIVVFKAIYDFFDGFFSVGEWLGKNEEDVSLLDRIKMGVYSAIAGFVSIFTDVFAWLTGGTSKSKEEMAVAMFNFVENLTATVIEWVSNAYDSVLNFFKSIPDTVMNMIDSMGTAIKDGYQAGVDKVTEIFGKITETFKSIYEAIENKLNEWRQSLGKIPGIGKLFKTDEEIMQEEIMERQVAYEKRVAQGRAGGTLLANTQRLEMTTGIPMTSGVMANIERASQQMDLEQQRKQMEMARGGGTNVIAPSNTQVNQSQFVGASTNTNNTNRRLRFATNGAY